jgi:hypothetical protein
MTILAFGICSATTTPQYMTDWEYVAYQGQIKEVSAAGGYIIVADVKVLLANNFVYKGNQCTTSVSSFKGKDLGIEDLSVGKWVLVWGPALKGDRIAAKDIYILSGPLSDKDLQKYIQSFQKWDYTAVKELAKEVLKKQ